MCMVPKCAEFHADSKSEDEIVKKWTNKSYFKKTSKKAVILGITFLSCGFFNFVFGFGISENSAFFGNHIKYLKKKVFLYYFVKL